MATPVTADTNRTSLYLSEEPDDCWGDAPGVGVLAPKGYEVRMTGETLIHDKQTIVSNSIRTDRMRDTLSEVAVSASGDMNFELAFRDWDLALQAAFADQWVYLIERTMLAGDVQAINATNRFNVMQGTVDFANFVVGADVWVSGFELNAINNGRMVITTVDGADQFIEVNTEVEPTTSLTDENSGSGLPLTFKTPKGIFEDLEIQSSSTIGSATTDFLNDLNLSVGQWILMGGWDVPGNNIAVQITQITANQLTFNTTALTVETAGQNVTLTAQRLKNGIARKSLLVEKLFGDVNEYVYFPGCRIGEMSLSVEAQAIVNGTFSITGKEGIGSATSVLGSIVPAGVKDALNATTNVGNISEAGVPLATAIRSIEMSVGNNLRAKPQIGSKSPIDVGYGFVDVTGTITVYFQDRALFDKFVNHEATSLSFRFTDSEGNIMVFTMPRLYFSSGTPTAPGGNDDVVSPSKARLIFPEYIFSSLRAISRNLGLPVRAIKTRASGPKGNQTPFNSFSSSRPKA